MITQWIAPYPHPKPQPPAQLYGLAALAAVGLLALWITAYNAFAAVGGTLHALAAATLIEAALVLDTLFVVRHRRSPAAIAGGAGILISVVVSATYNYLSAATYAPTLSGWPLLALAIGPLSALLFVALAMAHELHTHQQAVADWQRDRAEWIENQRLEAERAERERLAQAEAWRREQQEAERERQEREAEHRRALEREAAAERRAAEERARKRAERREQGAKVSAKAPETPAKPSEALPEWLTRVPKDRSDFRKLVKSGEITLPPDVTGPDLAAHIPAVGSSRTGQNWLADVRNGKEHHGPPTTLRP